MSERYYDWRRPVSGLVPLGVWGLIWMFIGAHWYYGLAFILIAVHGLIPVVAGIVLRAREERSTGPNHAEPHA